MNFYCSPFVFLDFQVNYCLFSIESFSLFILSVFITFLILVLKFTPYIYQFIVFYYPRSSTSLNSCMNHVWLFTCYTFFVKSSISLSFSTLTAKISSVNSSIIIFICKNGSGEEMVQSQIYHKKIQYHGKLHLCV